MGALLFTLRAFSNLGTVVPIFFLLKLFLLLVAVAPPFLSILHLLPAARVPKTGKGKGAAKDAVERKAPENEAAVQRA